ncbi:MULTISPECIES: hypothetical protein [unclassified Streptomyces]|nr:hypothetical protein [Streptomyces sp. Ru87]
MSSHHTPPERIPAGPLSHPRHYDQAQDEQVRGRGPAVEFEETWRA